MFYQSSRLSWRSFEAWVFRRVRRFEVLMDSEVRWCPCPCPLTSPAYTPIPVWFYLVSSPWCLNAKSDGNDEQV